MGSKHTPGPWRINDERCEHVGEVFVKAGGAIVATVQADNVEDWETIETAMDDARLIATAPDGLELARRIVEVDASWAADERFARQRPTIAGLVDDARKLIARAEGGAR